MLSAFLGRSASPWRAIEIEQGMRGQQHLVTTAEAFSTGRGTLPRPFESASAIPQEGNTLSDGFAVLAALLREGPQEMLTMRA